MLCFSWASRCERQKEPQNPRCPRASAQRKEDFYHCSTPKRKSFSSLSVRIRPWYFPKDRIRRQKGPCPGHSPGEEDEQAPGGQLELPSLPYKRRREETELHFIPVKGAYGPLVTVKFLSRTSSEGQGSRALSQRRRPGPDCWKFPLGIAESQNYPRKLLNTKIINPQIYSIHNYLLKLFNY